MTSANYYYVQGQQIRIQPREDLIAVQFPSRLPEAEIENFSRSIDSGLEPSQEFSEMQESNLRIYRVTNPQASALKSLETNLRSQAVVNAVGQVFTNEYEQPLVMTNEIVCKFKPEATPEEIEQLEREYDLEEPDALGFSENAFVLKVKPSSGRSAVEVANELVEQGHAVYAYPNFIEHIGYRQKTAVDTVPDAVTDEIVDEEAVTEDIRHGLHPTDPQFNQQWHLENTGQIAGGIAGTPGADIRATLAWQTTMGSPNIRLAVIDGGVDINHRDLAGKIVSPIDFTSTPPDTNPLGGSHGTEVAGMAVASANNGCAGAGSAPNCRLIPIRAGDTIPQVLMARGFAYAADRGADVITCSLGPVGPWVMTDALRDAIDYATTYGRNGRGCVYTQAVDNAANPINVDQVSAYERSIAVTRTNNRDLYDGAATGPELDLSAPGRDVLTITNTTDTNRCTTRTVPGTSYATPLTAGVACLVLSVNPNLSWEEVRQVLLDSADKIDGVANPYVAAPAGRPPGTRNDRYGYGRVNAQRAVQIAPTAGRRDLFLRDTVSDDGRVPQPNWGFWNSPDIWVRNADDGGTTHQNTIRGQDNFIYTRIRNRGTLASLPCWVRFYITTFAGTQFRYPYDYKPNTTTNPAGGTPGNLRPRGNFPTPASYLVGVQRIASIPAGGSTVARVRWERSLIPPEAGWHPCLLVEISPHDGPTATGMHVWENNNLAQKNITIVNARRGQMLEFPFRFGHATLNDAFVTLDVHKVKANQNWQVFFDAKQPQLLNTIALSAGLQISDTIKPIDVVKPIDGIKPIDTLKPIDFISPGLPGAFLSNPLQLTFLNEAKIAFNAAAGREDDLAMVVTFPQGSTLQLGRGQLSSSDANGSQELITDDRDLAAIRPPLLEQPVLDSSIFTQPITKPIFKPDFQVADLQGTKVLALNPSLSLNKINIPVLKAASQESALKMQVPTDAKAGEEYIFEVAQRDAQGLLVGGVSLQINIID